MGKGINMTTFNDLIDILDLKSEGEFTEALWTYTVHGLITGDEFKSLMMAATTRAYASGHEAATADMV
jgi:hypothetical protein